MKPATLLLTALWTIFGAVAGLSARPTAADAAKAGTLAAQIKTPAVRAALQCRVAFADTTANVPVKDRADAKGSGLFWAGYLRKLRAVDLAGCPDAFRAVFDKHLQTVSRLSESLNSPQPRMASNPSKVSHAAVYKRNAIPDPVLIGGNIKGHHDALGDCAETYRAVFAAANQSMKTAPASDGQLAAQIDGLLKE